MIINIGIAVLGVIVASTAGLTTIFGPHEAPIIVAAGGIALGVTGAIKACSTAIRPQRQAQGQEGACRRPWPCSPS